MLETTVHLPPLAEYLPPEDVRRIPGICENYPSKYSFDWLLRRHRQEFIAAGALILVAGRTRIHPQLAERVIVEIGWNGAAGITAEAL